MVALVKGDCEVVVEECERVVREEALDFFGLFFCCSPSSGCDWKWG